MRVRTVVRAVASSFRRRHVTSTRMESVGKFEGRLDRYKGVTVESSSEPCSPHQLAEKLSISLEDWRREGVRTVWFFVSPKDSAWIPLLVGEGFTFHHANSERLALMLWLGNFRLAVIGYISLIFRPGREVQCSQLRSHTGGGGGYGGDGRQQVAGSAGEVQTLLSLEVTGRIC